MVTIKYEPGRVRCPERFARFPPKDWRPSPALDHDKLLRCMSKDNRDNRFRFKRLKPY